MRYNRWYTYILFLQVLPVNVTGTVLTTAAQSGAFVDLELIIVTVQLAKTSAQRVKD